MISELWTSITNIVEDGQYLVFNTPHGNFHVINNGSITKIRTPGGPTPAKPWSKFFRYESINVDGRCIITYVENRTVDIVPFSHDRKQVFLITRQTKNGVEGGLALPGGHIDPPESIKNAAYRELSEEVLGGLDAREAVETMFTSLTWTPEVVAPGKVPVENVSVTMPFVAIMKPDTKMVAGDDAVDGQWFDIDNVPLERFHFLHHIDILNIYKSVVKNLPLRSIE